MAGLLFVVRKEMDVAHELAVWFRGELKGLQAELLALAPELADVPWRTGGWTRKQIAGHLLDSATNNRNVYVRASTEGHYTGPHYAQDAWVAAHGYAGQSWATLLLWWQVEHEMLAAVVDGIEEDKLGAICVRGSDAPVTLRFLIEDYIGHQRWHFKQLAAV